MQRSLAILILLTFALPLAADEVRLLNGDTVSGKVKSLDAKSLTLESENFGELKIARERIALIRLGDAPIAEKLTTPAANVAQPPKTSAVKPANANDDLVKQLRGIDPAMIKAVEEAMPLLNTSPEAKKYFNDRVGGLISGKVNIEDVRNDAKKAAKELEGLKEDLGDGAGAALDGYLSILNKFIRETEPPKAKPADTPPEIKK